MTSYYVLLNQGGAELDKLGPFKTDAKRDEEAREAWAEMNQETGSVHWLNVDTDDPGGPVSVGDYTTEELAFDGTEGQDRESYSDTQDRESYSAESDEEDDEPEATARIDVVRGPDGKEIYRQALTKNADGEFNVVAVRVSPGCEFTTASYADRKAVGGMSWGIDWGDWPAELPAPPE